MATSSTKDLLNLVRTKQAKIAALQAELDEVRELLSGAAPSARAKALSVREPVGPRHRRKARKGSSVSWAYEALKESDEPMHVDIIIERIKHKFGKDVDKQTLVSNLSRLIKAGDRFKRTGPNVFALIGGK